MSYQLAITALPGLKMSEVTEAKKECNKKVKKFRRVLGYEPSAVERHSWKNHDAGHKALLLNKIEVVIKSTEAVCSVAPSPNTPLVSILKVCQLKPVPASFPRKVELLRLTWMSILI